VLQETEFELLQSVSAKNNSLCRVRMRGIVLYRVVQELLTTRYVATERPYTM